MYYKLLLIIACTIGISSCMPSNNFEQKYFIEKQNWTYEDAKTFTFNVKDTSAKYAIHFLMQHHENYAYSNIWLRMITKYPDGKTDSARLEIPLALPSGQWLGNSNNGIVDHTCGITPNDANLVFTDIGQHSITIIQDMRVNPLKDVYNIGLSIQKK